MPVAAEVVGDAQGRDVHLALRVTWALVSSVASSVPKWKVTPRSTSHSKMASASPSVTVSIRA